MWLSMPGILGKSWVGRMPLCCVLSARTSDSCSLGLRPGRRDINLFTAWGLISYFTTWVCSQREPNYFGKLLCNSETFSSISGWTGNVHSRGVFAESVTEAPTRCFPPGMGVLLMTCRDQMDTWQDASLVWWWRTPCCACACGRLSCSFIEVKTSIQRKICCCYPKSAVMYLYRKCHHVHLSNLTATCKLSRYWMWKSTWFLVWLNEIEQFDKLADGCFLRSKKIKRYITNLSFSKRKRSGVISCTVCVVPADRKLTGLTDVAADCRLKVL